MPSGDAPPALDFDDVYAAYSQFRALFGISFTVLPGQAVALIGPTASARPRWPGWRRVSSHRPPDGCSSTART